jgi:hypothetical protein
MLHTNFSSFVKLVCNILLPHFFVISQIIATKSQYEIRLVMHILLENCTHQNLLKVTAKICCTVSIVIEVNIGCYLRVLQVLMEGGTF